MEEDKSPNERALAEIVGKMDEATLVAFVKQFKGSCNKCGKYGHKGAGCPNDSSCWYCKRTGHRRDTCELLLKHKAEINEQANIAVSESNEESFAGPCF